MKYTMLLVALLSTGCGLFSPATTKDVKTGLDAARLACIDSSDLTDAQAVKEACGILDVAIPAIEKLIFYRNLGRAAAKVPVQ